MNFKFPTSIVIYGFSRSGKSYWIRFFLSQNVQNFDRLIFISSTIKHDPYYRQFLKNLNVKYNMLTPYNNKDVDNFLSKIISSQKKHKRRKVLVILDDINGICKSSKKVVQMATSSRHYNTSFIYSSQAVSKVDPVIRQNSEYNIIFNQRCHSSLKKIHEEIFIMEFPRFRDFLRFFKNKLDNHVFIFFNRITNKYKFLKCP